jgi:hypothetical protein
VYFRLNEGGANSLTFDSASGVLDLKGNMTAGNITGTSFKTATTGARVEITQSSKERISFFNGLGNERGGIGIIDIYNNEYDSVTVQSYAPVQFNQVNSAALQAIRCSYVSAASHIGGVFTSDVTAGTGVNYYATNAGTGRLLDLTGPSSQKYHRVENDGSIYVGTTDATCSMAFSLAGTERLRIHFVETARHIFMKNNSAALKILSGSTAEVQARLGDDSGYAAMRATVFNPTSARATKRAIEPALSALNTIVSTPAYRYHLTNDPPGLPKRWGIIAEETPDGIRSGDGIDLYAMTTVLWRAVQELIEERNAKP